MKKCCFLLFLCGLMTSCLEDINLDTGEKILHVYCILRQGPEQELELSYIAPTGGMSSPVGDDVMITLYDEGAPVGQFHRVSETKWHLDFLPQGGHTYKLEAIVSGQDTLEAETRFPIPCTVMYGKLLEDDKPLGDYFYKGYEFASPEDHMIPSLIH